MSTDMDEMPVKKPKMSTEMILILILTVAFVTYVIWPYHHVSATTHTATVKMTAPLIQTSETGTVMNDDGISGSAAVFNTVGATSVTATSVIHSNHISAATLSEVKCTTVAETAILFDDVKFSAGITYDDTTREFKLPVDGIYNISVSANIPTPVAGVLRMYVSNETATITNLCTVLTDQNQADFSLSGNIAANADDVIKIFVYNEHSVDVGITARIVIQCTSAL